MFKNIEARESTEQVKEKRDYLSSLSVTRTRGKMQKPNLSDRKRKLNMSLRKQESRMRVSPQF